MASFASLGSALLSTPRTGLLTTSKLPQPPKPPKPPGLATLGTGVQGKPTTLKIPPFTGNGFNTVGTALAAPAAVNALEQAKQPTTASQPTGAADQSTPSALDATYYANVAANQFKTNNGINADLLKYSNDQTALQDQLGQYARQQPLDQLKLEQGANNRGALFSSVYGQDLGNLNQSYLDKQSAATQKYGGDMQALAAEIAALQGGIPLYDTQQAAAAAQRATAAAQANPALGAPLPPTGATPAGTKLGNGLASIGTGIQGPLGTKAPAKTTAKKTAAKSSGKKSNPYAPIQNFMK